MAKRIPSKKIRRGPRQSASVAGVSTHPQAASAPTSNGGQRRLRTLSDTVGFSISSTTKEKPKRRGISLRRQLLLTIFPAVLAPLAIVSLIDYKLVQQRTEAQIQLQLQNQALLASEGTSAVLDDLLDLPRAIAASPLVVNEAFAGGNQVESDGLDKLSMEELEARFKGTKLLRIHRALNAYLQETIETADISEISITERHGFNVAYSEPTTDFVQSDEDWWQKGKSEGLWIGPPDFNYAAKGFTVELAQAIHHHQSGAFVGVVRAVLPARKFSLVTKYLQHTGISGSQRVQLIDADKLSVIDTFSPKGFHNTRKIIGGEGVKQLIASLIQSDAKETNPEHLLQTLNTQGSLQELTVMSSAEEPLLVSLISQDKQYKIAIIPGTTWVAIASMDLAEISVTSRQLLLFFALTAIFLGGVTAGLVLLLAHQVSTPISDLASKAKQFAAGDLNVVAEPRGNVEIQTLAQTFNTLVVQVKELLMQQAAETHKAQLFATITGSPADNRLELKAIFDQAVDQIREFLAADRVIFYRVKPDRSSNVTSDQGSNVESESVAPNLPSVLDYPVPADCIPLEVINTGGKKRVFATHNMAAVGLQIAHQQCLQALQVKSSLVVSVLIKGQVFGFLIAHHCRASHDWQPLEIDFVEQLAAQLELVIERVNSLEQIREARQTAEVLTEEHRQQNKFLQQQVAQLIRDIAGVSQGDLTVRATVNVGQLGSVANFFNLTIERLQQLVTQVKQSTVQVNTSLQQNRTAAAQLADEARRQSQETTRTLCAMRQMTLSTELIADSAGQAAEVAHTVAITAAEGEARMDLIFQTILQLQEVIAATAKKVAELGGSSQHISKVTDLIEEIAMQIHQLSETNSFDLTGMADGGPDFAKVAEKVRILATRTSEATHPIDNFLNILQRETQQVVEAIEHSKAKVFEGSHLVQTSKQSLGEMLTVSNQIDQLARSISEATASQVQTSQTVSSLMQDVAELSENTSHFSRQISSALQDTVDVAEELQTSVSTFKVDPDA